MDTLADYVAVLSFVLNVMYFGLTRHPRTRDWVRGR